MNRHRHNIFLSACAAALLLCLTGQPSATDRQRVADRVEAPVRASIDIRRQTQQMEDQWTIEQQQQQFRYEALSKENTLLVERAAELEQQIERHRLNIGSINENLNKIEGLKKEIKPLLEHLVVDLEQWIASDPPFLADERRERVARLKAGLADPDVSLSEIFRKLMEAFLVEAEYGHTIEVYPDAVPVKGTAMRAHIFRMGRVSLFYRTPDGASTGYYDVAAREWKPLPEKYARVVRDAMEMASRQRPVELLSLPVGRMSLP